MKSLFRIFLLSLAVLLPLACGTDEKAQDAADIVQVEQELPHFEVTLNDGTKLSPAALKGRVAVITFFNTDCGDCQRYLPVLDAFYREVQADEAHPLRSVAFLPISRAQAAESVAAYWQAHQFSLPYAAEADRTVYDRFARSGIPRNYVVNAEGRVTAIFDDQNPPTAEQLQAALQQATAP